MLISSLAQSSLPPVEHKASTICLHVRPISHSSVATVRQQVVWGQPFLRLQVGVHLKAVLGIRFFIFSTTLWLLVFLYSSSFEIFSGKRMRQIFLRDPLWKALILFISPFTTRQHSEPNRRTDLTLLLYSLTFILRLHCFDFQMGRSTASTVCFTEPCSDILLHCIVLADKAAKVVEVFSKIKWINAHHFCVGGTDV